MLLIGENLNIMSKTLGPALKERKGQPIQEMAKSEVQAGIDYIDVNIGPARKDGPDLLGWAVKTVQEAVTLPLSLDTTNMDAMEAGLAAHRGKPIINSVSLQPGRAERLLPLAKKYGAYVIALLWGAEGMPRDENERAVLAVDFLQKAAEFGIPNEDILIDPIISPVSVEINQVKSCLTFQSLLTDIAPGCGSTCGLSNISNGAPGELRHWLDKTYFIMLRRYGLSSAIVNSFDQELIEIARGKKPEIEKLIHHLMDGESVDRNLLSETELKYYKSARVLLGHTVYSHLWLEA
ncbi:MAG: dihydropteroate synthase [bacterium]|nr:dihydropteroate synthase [bacterium]